MEVVASQSNDDAHPIIEENVILEQDDSYSSYQQSSENSGEYSDEDQSLVHTSSKKPERMSVIAENMVKGTLNSSGLSRQRFSRSFGAHTDDGIRSDPAKWAEDSVGVQELDELRLQGFRSVLRSPSNARGALSKKRKPEKFPAGNLKAKRMKRYYRDEYRQLFNSTINQSELPVTGERHIEFVSSQIGATNWSSSEKCSFFEALERLGRDNVRGVAAMVVSKSEIEVQQYTQLLRKGLESKILTESPGKIMSLTDIPAAMQVSEECCEALERAADALLYHQERYEAKLEKAKWGDSWLLTSEVSDWVEDQLAEEESVDSLKEVLPAAELLKLRNWLEVSARVFMNPAAPLEDQNWQHLIEPGELHGIRATAFEDFHRLTLSITKRLVSATIFCAMSRLRALDPRSFRRVDMIKAKDVKAAAKILGMELNGRKYWRNCPRRCHLEIYERLPSRSTEQKPLSYNEVEAILRLHRRSSRQSSRESSLRLVPTDGSTDCNSGTVSETSHSDTNSDIESELEDDLRSHFEGPPLRDLASEYNKPENDSYGWPINPSDSEFANPGNRGVRGRNKLQEMEAAEREQIRYADALDLRASLQEERRLWAILNQEPPFAIKPEELELPEQPMQIRRELEDWRNKLEYRSGWEVLQRPLPAKKSQRNSSLLEEGQHLGTGGPGEPKFNLRKVDTRVSSREDVSHDDADHIYSD